MLDPVRKANILIIVIIAVVGLGSGNAVASFTGDYVNDYIHLNAVNFKENGKMMTVEDGQFSPITVNEQKIPVPPNNNTAEINKTNSTTNTNNDDNGSLTNS